MNFEKSISYRLVDACRQQRHRALTWFRVLCQACCRPDGWMRKTRREPWPAFARWERKRDPNRRKHSDDQHTLDAWTFVVCIAVGREGLHYRSRKESGGLNGGHTVWPIWSRGFEMRLPNRQKKPKFIEMRAPCSLPFYKKYLKMLKWPKKQPFSELSGKYPGNRGWKPA